MIPTKLVLQNFLCYRDQVTLDLRTVRVACISGENGAGKSSLLDAITWALWGKARGAAERDLISLGATEMGVDFQFVLGAQEYRVLRRRRRRASQDLAQLEVQIRELTPDGDGPWRPITGDTLAQTQRLLTAAVGMEYDTFINSAFILQGRADEFTTKGPADRKQVLADILGLGRYDEVEERARALRRERETARKEADAELGRIDEELRARPGIERELGAVSGQLVALVGAIARLGEELDGLKARRAELEGRDRAAREAEARADEHDRETRGLRALIGAAEGRVATLEALIAEADAIRAGHAELVEAQRAEAAANAALAEVSALRQEHRDVERQIDLARSRLLQEQHALEHRLTELRGRQARLPALDARHAELTARLEAVRAAEGQRAILNESITSATEEMGGRKAENDHLLREMKRLKALQTQMDEAGADCPLCRRPLADSDRRHVHDGYQREGLALKGRHVANRERIATIEREIADCATRLGELDRATRAGQALAGELGDVGRQLTEAREAGTALLAEGGLYERISAQLAGGHFAAAAQRDLAALDARIAALAYDAAAHRRIAERVAALRPFDRRLRELETAEHSIALERERLREYRASLALREGARDVERARAAELRAGVGELPALLARYEDVELAHAVRGEEQRALTRRQGDLEGALRRLADLEDAGRALRVERTRLAEEEGAYRDLAKAFGKTGIQAMIIEAAVPEIQDEANAILANMPGNSMRVEFRTQRATQKGDTVEALDILIGDEAGQRAYAMYSGGESFRINFAIRVALAKLLARRAGAKLQLLVIDEGFGTQDARGRDSIVEAIRSIEDDFATILVITHVNELKEVFPTQIIVEKTPGGSRIAVA